VQIYNFSIFFSSQLQKKTDKKMISAPLSGQKSSFFLAIMQALKKN